MKLLLQRVTEARVLVDDEVVGAIDHGLLVFVGLEPADDNAVLDRMKDRLLRYRVFADEKGRMNLDVSQVSGASLLLVSQFTLAADTARGRRPSFSGAMPPDHAAAAFSRFVHCVQANFAGRVETGRFGADMRVALVNDGPVTFLLQS